MSDFASPLHVRPVDDKGRLAVLEETMTRSDELLVELRRAFFTITYVAPVKAREGMIRFADGTRWNPGSGAGYYAREAGAWHKL